MEALSFVLVPMVYAAFLAFVCGVIWRVGGILRRPSFAPTLKALSEHRPAWLRTGRCLPHAHGAPPQSRSLDFSDGATCCLLLLVLGHLELFADMAWLQVWPHDIFLGAGFVGVIGFVCLLFLLFRRFVPPAKDLSVPEDYFLLIALLLAVVFGAEMHLARRLYFFDSMGVAECHPKSAGKFFWHFFHKYLKMLEKM